MSADREELEFDVVIVGAGPAGLAAAIRLKQLNSDLSVAVLEKGSEVGAHILSGAVIDPVGLDKLLPDWRAGKHPLKTLVSRDEMVILTAGGRLPLPSFVNPPLMSSKGCFVTSLGDVCRWLGEQAEALGVDILPGFPASELLMDDEERVVGVVIAESGLTADGTPGPDHQPGYALNAKYVLLGEGARGSVSKQAIAKFGLDAKSGPQKYGLGVKELWQVDEAEHREGLVQHFMGWPLGGGTTGGGFIYHMQDRQVMVGMVVHLDYANPYTDPFAELQKFKTHPTIKPLFAGATRTGYGARAISGGGYQSVPKLAFPGGALIGDSAGFMNLPRIKGSHNAVLSGMLGAEHVAAAIAEGRSNDLLGGLDTAWRAGAIGKELSRVRNVKPLWSRMGTAAAVLGGGADMWVAQIFGRPLLGEMQHPKADFQATQPAASHTPPDYPKPDNVLTFDKASSLALSGTDHRDGQPAHLKVGNEDLQRKSELGVYDGPSAHYCPAGVYAWREVEGETKFVIHAQNCVHCKTCDIKDPNQNITWVTPEGGGGPNYPNM